MLQLIPMPIPKHRQQLMSEESERQQTAANEKLIPNYILRDAPERAQTNKPFSPSL
jgi:hypothetical protein